MARGNTENLKPRTQEGFQAALVASIHAGDAALIRKAMMKHGYMAKVIIEGGKVVAISGDLLAEVTL
jgi:DNA-binding FadR family transcriptional regulator